jgi:SAM-dependent methyltransferase
VKASPLWLRLAAACFPFTLAALVYVLVHERGGPAGADHALSPTTTTTSPAAGAPAPALSSAFENIYAQGLWGTDDQDAAHSGTGSTGALTVVYRAYLQAFLKEHEIHSVVDAGCGDWEFSKLMDWAGIDYKGYDIVASVIEKDKKLYARPTTQFFTADIIETDLPPADLLLVKHVLQHLPNQTVLRFLRQLPKYKFVLLTDGVDDKTLSAPNVDIPAGAYRPIDLTRPPFNLPAVKALLYNDGLDTHEVLFLERHR